jgi:Subtilase family/Peptidase inhibitor I9
MSIVPGVSRVVGVRAALLLAFPILMALTFLGVASAQAAAPETDRYIVVLKDDVAHPGNIADRHEENRGADPGFIYRHALKGYSTELTEAEARAIRQDPSVDYVTRSGMLELTAQAPSTGVKRVFAPNNSTLDIDEVDDVQTNVDVALIDTGIDYDHPDLRVVSRTACTNFEYCVDNSDDDLQGHGTHIAGILGAKDNQIGTVGVAPGARLWAVKVTIENQGGVYTENVLAGLDWVEEHADQIEVVNISLAGNISETPAGAVQSVRESIEESVNAGVVFVAASGNWGKDAGNYYPVSFPDVIGVSAVADYDGQAGSFKGSATCTDNVSPFSAHGDGDDTFWRQKDSNGKTYGSGFGSVIDIAAPGVCIESTYKNGEYRTWTGTSMAAPHVAGAAAILAAKKNPNTRAEVEGIRNTLRANGNYNWTDDSGDGVKEPLLDVTNASVFKNPHPGNVTAVGVTSNTSHAIQLFARTTWGGIVEKVHNPYANPYGWQPWGDPLSLPLNGAGQTVTLNGRPAVLSRDSATRDVFVRASDNQLYFRHWDSNQGTWTTWFHIPGPNNAPVTSEPAVAKLTGIPGGLTLVVRGSDGQIHFKNYNGQSWGTWVALGTPPGGATSNPSATLHNGGVLHVVVNGGDNAVWDRNWSDAAGWSAWGSLGGVATSSPAIATTGNQRDMWLVVRGTDNGLWYRRFQADYFGWTSWSSLGGQTASEPAVVSRDNSGADVFLIGMDGKIQQRRYTASTWTKWMRIDDDCPPGAC